MAKDNKKSKDKKKPKKVIKLTPENKCSFCVGTKCCTYITQQIDTPRSIAEFDFLMWQLSHRHVQAYKDEDGWFLLIADSPCVYIQDDGRCGIYEKRPMICREYDNDYCEYDAPAEEGFDLFFEDAEALDVYCRKRFKKWEKRFKKLAGK
jgi:Fe-S-cluster containining protein